MSDVTPKPSSSALFSRLTQATTNSDWMMSTDRLSVKVQPPTPVAMGESSTPKTSGGFLNFLCRSSQSTPTPAPQPPSPVTVEAEVPAPSRARRPLALGSDTWSPLGSAPLRQPVPVDALVKKDAPLSVDAGLQAPAPLWCDITPRSSTSTTSHSTAPRLAPSLDAFMKKDAYPAPLLPTALVPPKPLSTSPLRQEEERRSEALAQREATALVPAMESPNDSDFGLAVPPSTTTFSRAVEEHSVALEEREDTANFQNFVSSLFSTDDQEAQSFNAFEMAMMKPATAAPRSATSKYTTYLSHESGHPLGTTDTEGEDSWEHLRKVVGMVMQATGFDGESSSSPSPSPSGSKSNRFNLDGNGSGKGRVFHGF